MAGDVPTKRHNLKRTTREPTSCALWASSSLLFSCSQVTLPSLPRSGSVAISGFFAARGGLCPGVDPWIRSGVLLGQGISRRSQPWRRGASQRPKNAQNPLRTSNLESRRKWWGSGTGFSPRGLRADLFPCPFWQQCDAPPPLPSLSSSRGLTYRPQEVSGGLRALGCLPAAAAR